MEAMHVDECLNSRQQNILRCNNSSRIKNDVSSSSSSGCVQKYINTLAIVEAQQKRLFYHGPLSSLDSEYVLHDDDDVHLTISSAQQLQNYPSLSTPAIQAEETNKHQLETTNVHIRPITGIMGPSPLSISHQRTLYQTHHLKMDAIEPDPSQPRSQNQEQATQSVLVENHHSFSTLISTSYFLNFLCKNTC